MNKSNALETIIYAFLRKKRDWTLLHRNVYSFSKYLLSTVPGAQEHKFPTFMDFTL